MSNSIAHLEKILLGVGLLVGLGMAYFGYRTMSDIDETFTAQAPRLEVSDTSVEFAEQVSKALNSIQSNRIVRTATVPSDRSESGEREIDLFIGVPLFANRDRPNEPFDIYTSPDVLPPIPNGWWLKHGISPRFADSKERDEDGDGFTNLEEYQAGTGPADFSDHPPLVTKLRYVDHESLAWIVEFGFQAGGKQLPKGEAQTELDGALKKLRQNFEAGVEPGGSFFSEDPLKNRFKLIEIEERQVFNDRLNIEETLKFMIFEDLKENKKGKKYEVPNRFPRAAREKFMHYDRTAVLELLALNYDGEEFRVEEGTRFTLPPDGDDAAYFLKEVTPEQIIVEWEGEDAEVQTIEIPHGRLPDVKFKR